MLCDGVAAATDPPGGRGRARWAAAAAGPSLAASGVLRATRELGALELCQRRVLIAFFLVFRG